MNEPVKISFYRNHTNPGFEIGDTLLWDENVIPQGLQPRPMMGVITGFWYNGCAVETKPGHPIAFFTFEHICRVCVVEKVQSKIYPT